MLVLDVFSDDEHGIVTREHEIDCDGDHGEYLTAHAVTLRRGRMSTWEERPGSPGGFEKAWGTA
jgi:hypothetical protein